MYVCVYVCSLTATHVLLLYSTFGWVAVDEVAIAHDQGLGDNRQSSLGPLYRCNVDYEAAQCALAKRSYAVEG